MALDHLYMAHQKPMQREVKMQKKQMCVQCSLDFRVAMGSHDSKYVCLFLQARSLSKGNETVESAYQELIRVPFH